MDFSLQGEDLLNTALSWGLDTMSSKWGGDQNYDYQRRLQKHDFDFQREMWNKQLQADNTAIQRRMKDADEAGLNANLMFNAGSSGASTPSVSGGSTGANVGMQTPNTAASLMYALTKAKNDAEIRNLDANTGKTKVETEIAEITRKWTPEIIKSQTRKQQQETATEIAKTVQAEIDAEMKRLDLTKRDKEYWRELEIYKKELEAKMIELGFDTSVIGATLNGLGKAANAISPVTALTGRSLSQQKNYGYVTTY